MTPADNILYFNNDIDIRLCLKNGYTTLKAVWSIKNDIEYYKQKPNKLQSPSAVDRYHWAMQKQDIWDQPFRKGSYRIAIKRDPIERFISAVSYLDSVKVEPNFLANKKSYIDLTSVNKEDINSILDAFDNQTLRDEHFFSQSYFMGHPDQYDKVYYLHHMQDLLQWLEKKIKPELPLTGLWKNKTQGSDSRVVLTDAQQMRIIKMYAKDYANGWY